MTTIEKTPIEGCVVIRFPSSGDARGSFARAFSCAELAEAGIDFAVVQANLASTAEAGTTRGLHYQVAPYGETKLMRCVRGSVYDALVDLREGSPTYGQSFGIELTAENGLALLVPKGCAHGYMTLEPDSQMLYFVDQGYEPSAERVLSATHADHPVDWPREIAVQSDKDRSASTTEPAAPSGY